MDWAGTWFGIAERLGESMTIISARIDGQGKRRWQIMDHSRIDGIGAVALQLNGPSAAPPKNKRAQAAPPSFFRTLVAIFKHVRSRGQRTRWKQYFATEVGCSPVMAWTVFDVATTAQLASYASSQKVSFNTFLLYALDAAVRTHLTQGGDTRWSIPVNMRGLIDLPMHSNQLSFLNVTFAPDLALPDFHRRIGAKFKEGNHWANWALMHIGKYIGLARAEQLYRRSYARPNPETGTFSNLGEWQSGAIRPDETFIIAAPTSKLTPVAVAAITVNGKLSVVLQLHPSLRPTAADVRAVLEQWLHGLQRRSGVDCMHCTVEVEHIEVIKKIATPFVEPPSVAAPALVP